MQNAFANVLGAVLAAAVAYFVVMGLLQWKRSRRLVCQANAMGFHFGPEDLFDMPTRFGDFALFGIGHSCRAHNVSDGRVEQWPVRTFDFHYEAGHGTRRQGRHYFVVAFETHREIGQFLLWSDEDADAAPICLRHGARQQEGWSCLGGGPLAEQLAAEMGQFALAGGSIEARRNVLLLSVPVRRGGPDMDLIAPAAKILRRMFPADKPPAP
jgi:hypothetical protein